MADNTSYESFQKSGFYEAADTGTLSSEAAKIPTSDDALRKQAVDQYADTLSTLDTSLSKQLTSIITSQASDEKLLNEQYNNSISSMMAKLRERGLHSTPSLPAAQTAALEKHRNEITDFRSSIYRLQRAVPEKKKTLLATDYDKAIAQRVAANRASNIPTASSLLTNIAKLQSSGYIDYINNLLEQMSLARKRASSSRSRKSSSPSPKKTYTPPPKAPLDGYDNLADKNYVQAHQHFYYASGK